MTIDWARFENCARAVLGRPYKFGGKWPLGDPDPQGGVDCSGFVRWAYSRVGVYLLDGSHAQYLSSDTADKPFLGCLGFFKRPETGEVHHVGILLDKEVIEARGEPYGKVILRPRKVWEAWKEFSGWRVPDKVADALK